MCFIGVGAKSEIGIKKVNGISLAAIRKSRKTLFSSFHLPVENHLPEVIILLAC